ncbi:MAG: thermosome subunit beta [Thermoplasmata archaeon]
MLAGQPQQQIIILREGTRKEGGRSVQLKNIAVARAVADAVKSTLGPKGMDKMLVDSMGDVIITNDGATILKEIEVEHPIAKMIVEVAKTQDEECGDGTTTSVILAGELLKRSEALIEKNVHPTIIAAGYKLAAEKAVAILNEMAENVPKENVDILKKAAAIAMISKNVSAMRVHLAEIATNAVLAITERIGNKNIADIDNIKIEKKHGQSINDTVMINGIILDKEITHEGMPKYVKNAKIALVSSPLEIKKTEVSASIEIRDPRKLKMFLDEEENVLRKMVGKIKASGANVLLCEKGIDDLALHYLAKEGIVAIRRISESDMKRLVKATGGKIVSRLDDITPGDLGIAESVEEKKIAGDKLTFITGCKGGKAVSILIRGGTEHVIAEVERALIDALSVVSDIVEDEKIIAGGGAGAMEIARGLRDYSASVGGREQLAVEAFAEAMDVLPRTLAENAGLDPINTIIDLRKAHQKGLKNTGINVFTGNAEDMRQADVIEPLRVAVQALHSATDVATMILRIDDIIAARPVSKAEMAAAAGGGGGMGGMGGMPGMM